MKSNEGGRALLSVSDKQSGVGALRVGSGSVVVVSQVNKSGEGTAIQPSACANSNDEFLKLEAIEVEIPMQNPKRSSQASRQSMREFAVDRFDDSMNEEDDEIEDEKRSPVSMQLIQTSAVTRAGAQRINFGPARKFSPSIRNNDNMQAGVNQSILRPVSGELAIGTEETVLRNNDPKLMSHSPSIIDVGYGGNNQVTPASSFVSLNKEHHGILSGGAGNSAHNENNGGSANADVGFFSLRPTSSQVLNQNTPKTGSLKGSGGHGTSGGHQAHNSQQYMSAKVGTHHSASLGDNKDRLNAASCNQFDHTQELNGQRMIDEHTFGNHNSKDELLMKVTEAANGHAIGQENEIIRPSGSRTSIKQQQKEDENVAPSNSTANDDAASGNNKGTVDNSEAQRFDYLYNNNLPNSSTAIQSSFTNAPKQDS